MTTAHRAVSGQPYIRYRVDAGTADARAVTVLETEPEGHRLDYLCHLWSAVDPSASSVVTSERAVCSEEYRRRPVLASARVQVLPDESTRYDTITHAVSVAAAGRTRLVVPDSDLYLPALLRYLARRPWTRIRITMLVMRTNTPFGGKAATRPLPALVKMAAVQLLRAFPQVRVRFLTDAFGVVKARPGYPGVQPVPDPVAAPDRAPTRPSWFPSAERSAIVVGAFGVLGPRKNIPLLLEAVESVDGAVLVLGGRLDPAVRSVLDTPSARRLDHEGRLVVRDAMLSIEEFGAALAHSDIAAVLHDNDSPSGVLAEGCVRGTPCLVPVGGWLHRVVTATGVGRAVELNREAVATGIRELAGSRVEWRAAAGRHTGRIGVSGFVQGLVD